MSDPQRIDPELARALENLGRAVKANPHNEAPEPKPPATIIQLPFWPEPVRGMPIPSYVQRFFPPFTARTVAS